MVIKSAKLKRKEEIANSVSHGIATGLAIAGTTLLITLASIRGNVWHIVSYSVFGACMIFVYLSSTLFHSAKRQRVKFNLNKLDHSAVFIMIAGSYTPLSLTSLRGWVGWTLFGLIWTLAAIGVIYKVWFYASKWNKLSAWLYVVMGWLVLIAIVPIVRTVPPIPLAFLISGCVSYTLGVIFYLKSHIPYFHLIFHIFIMAGSICHFFSFLYILPK